MLDRDAQIDAFLVAAGWQQAARTPLAGDASNRRYIRLRDAERKAIVMDAPSERGEDVRPFVDITGRLAAAGLSPPQILHQDADHGLLLLEDMGDALFARVLKADPGQEQPLYRAATDVLVHMHGHIPAPGLAPYDAEAMAPLAALAAVWYAPDPALEAALAKAMHALCTQHLGQPTRLIQRDFHAENLLWLPERAGLQRVGLLDYQDAMLGPLAYDLASLVMDARRDVSVRVRDDMIAYFAQHTGQDPDTVQLETALCGAQRNLRILGVFARLWLRDGKAHYLPLIPRVWDHLRTCLAHPALAPITELCAKLPAPTAEYLLQIKARR